MISALTDYGIKVSIYDPWANPKEVEHEYNLITTDQLPAEKFDAVVLGVAHKEFMNLDLKLLQRETSILYDVKGILHHEVDGKL